MEANILPIKQTANI